MPASTHLKRPNEPHGVDIMLRAYIKCIDGHREVPNQRIQGAVAA
ncbi:hypothetical protein GCM10010176_097090 [Nonomuraea spiralis]|nr:hypothetical protein GCM10010176_097090 [Nonomuraea spiralis]